MPQGRQPPLSARAGTIAGLLAPPRVESLGPLAGRFVHALRLVAAHERMGRDPVPELAVRLGSVDVAAKTLNLAQTIAATWPENIAVSRYCCWLLTHDEATIGAFVDAAANADWRAFEAVLDGFVRPEGAYRLWEAALALVAAEIRAD